MVSNMDAALSLDQIRWLVAFIKTITCSPVVYTSMEQVYQVSHTLRLSLATATATCFSPSV